MAKSLFNLLKRERIRRNVYRTRDEARLDRAREADAPADETERQARQPAYVARISVREGGLDTEQGWKTIEPGMAVTAEIKTGQRRIVEYLLSPLLRYRHDAGRER